LSTIRLKFSIDLRYEVASTPSDFIFNIHAARTSAQSVVAERVLFDPAIRTVVDTDLCSGSRVMRLQVAPGPLSVHYDAIVDIRHHVDPAGMLAEVPIARIPSGILPYLYPSRYCQSDRLRSFAAREFGHLKPGYRRVQAIQDWVRQHVSFVIGSSNISTSALDTLVDRVGVCRDFAHLMIALCRALNIPARFVSGVDYGADPSIGPTDFHAYVEVFLGQRWYLFEPSGISPPMGLVRIGTGRDAAEVAFATIFGAVKAYAPVVAIEAVEDRSRGIALPRHCAEALSSHEGLPVPP
jgi:transglutaminase-like putative cysteine protease